MPDFFLDENQHSVHSSQYAILSQPGAVPQGTAAPKAAPAPAPAAPSGEIARVMNVIKGVINEDVVKTTQAVFKFDIKGEKTIF
jgi:hypothetical protein